MYLDYLGVWDGPLVYLELTLQEDQLRLYRQLLQLQYHRVRGGLHLSFPFDLAPRTLTLNSPHCPPFSNLLLFTTFALLGGGSPELFPLEFDEFFLAVHLHFDVFLMLLIKLRFLLLVTQLPDVVILVPNLFVLNLRSSHQEGQLLFTALANHQRTLQTLTHLSIYIILQLLWQSKGREVEQGYHQSILFLYNVIKGKLLLCLHQQLYQKSMMKQSRKALSLQALAKHQQRLRGMIQKIQKYKPTFHINNNYRRKDIEKRIEQRERESDKLFQENMKLIYRIQSTGPRIETRKFPQVKPNPKRLKTLSQHASKSSISSKFRIKDVFRNEEEVFQQNLKMITNIECQGPKIECWTSKKVLNLNALMRMKKKEEERKIMDKFKQISKELNKINKMKSFKRSSSISSLKSKG